MSSDEARPWTQDHYVTRNSTTDDASGYRCWLTCRCGWDSGTLPDGNLPTTHRAELEHYVAAWRTRPVTDAEVEAARAAYAAKQWDQARSAGTEPNTERGRAEKARYRMRAALEAARKVEQ